MTPALRMRRQLLARRSWRQSEALRLVRVGGVSHNRQGPLGPLTARTNCYRAADYESANGTPDDLDE